MEVDFLNLLASSFTLLILLAGTMVAILQLRALRKQIKAQHEWNRRVTALDYTFSNNPMLREIRHRLETALNLSSRGSGEISLDDILELQKSNPTIRPDLQIILGRFENMAIGIKHQVYDEKICKDMLHGAVIRYYRFFRQYIDDIRKQRNSSTLYENFEYYAKKWSTKEVETIEPTA